MSRNTQSGLEFENRVSMPKNGVDVSKYKLYQYLQEHNIDWRDILSKKLLPDEAYYNEETKEFTIYEKKFQAVDGSVDEKPQTCGFKIWEFQKIGKALGAKKTTYTYIFSEWFSKPEYKDMLEYIKTVEGCDYIIIKE